MTGRARKNLIFKVVSIIPIVVILLTCLMCKGTDKTNVVVYTSIDQVFSEPVFREFEKKTGIHVRAVFDTEETKSTGVLSRLIAEANNTQADVFWSGDPVRPFLLIRRNMVEPYTSPQAAEIPQAFKSADGTWAGFAARARVLLINRDKLGGCPMPGSIRDLGNPKWKGEAAIANPIYGTTTMQVAAWFSVFGTERAQSFMNSLKDNKVVIASSNGEVKRLVVSGEITFGLTDTDDAFEALQSGASVEVVYPDQDSLGTLIMPTTALMLKGGPNPKSAQRLIDFLLSKEVETMLAQSAAHMPLHSNCAHPPQIKTVAEILPMQVDYAEIARYMEVIQPFLRGWMGL
jgi:iron(III) transport system substrate-binding protein